MTTKDKITGVFYFFTVALFLVLLGINSTYKRQNLDLKLEIHTIHDIFYVDGLTVTTESGKYNETFNSFGELYYYLQGHTLTATKDCIEAYEFQKIYEDLYHEKTI